MGAGYDSLLRSIVYITDTWSSRILYTYPEVAGVAGLQGVLTYALASSLPFLTFPPLAKRLRRLCPHGFVLTEFVRERFGVVAALFLSACSCLTMWVPSTFLRSRLSANSC
jgi:hypothetical protein